MRGRSSITKRVRRSLVVRGAGGPRMCWWFAMQSSHKNPGAINEDTYRVWWEAGLGLAFEKA
jgi:hypothetical protein